MKPEERQQPKLPEEIRQSRRRFPRHGPFWPVADDHAILQQVDIKTRTRETVQTPQQVSQPRCVVTAVAVGGKNYSQQDIRFTQPSDPNFAGAYIWVKGYNRGTSALSAKLPFVEMMNVRSSPASLLLDRTTEEIIIKVQSYNSNGLRADFDQAPTVSVTLI